MSLSIPGKLGFAGLRPTELSSLWLAVPPILAFVLAGLIFEFSAFDLIGLSAELGDVLGRGSDERDTALTLAESRARFLWSTAVLLFFFLAIALVIASVVIMAQCLSTAALRLYLSLGVGMCVVVGVHLIYGGATNSGTNAIFQFTFDSLRSSGRFDEFQLKVVRNVVFTLNGCVVVAPCIALFAACATLTEGDGRDGDLLDHLQAQMRRLKMLLNCGSALLVVGVLHMVVWLRWPAALVSDPEVSGEILGFSTALSMFWGAAFSVLAVAFYVPASFVLSQRAERAIAANPEKAGGTDAREWLKRHGLSVTPAQQAPQVVMMVAPLLAGPVGTAISALSNPLAGG